MRKNAKKEKAADIAPVEHQEQPSGVGPSGLAWHTEKRRAGDLKEWDKNPRRLSDSQAKHLATSLIKFGYVEPIQINTDNTIIGGHMRHRILIQANMITLDDMIDVRVPSRLLDEDEQEELAIRLNKNTGDWDWEVLALFDQSNLRGWGFSPMDFGIEATKGVDFEPTKLEPEPLKETSLKPSKPRTCTHCEQRCHCVVEE